MKKREKLHCVSSKKTMKKMKTLQSFFVIFLTISVRAIQLCCPEGEIYSKIGVEQTVSVNKTVGSR